MRLLTFRHDGVLKPGALVGEDGIADLTARIGASSLRQIIEEDRIGEAANAAKRPTSGWPRRGSNCLSPMPGASSASASTT